MKRFISFFTIICVLCLLSYSGAADSGIKLYVNGVETESARAPYLKDGKLMLSADSLPYQNILYGESISKYDFVESDIIEETTPLSVLISSDSRIVSVTNNKILKIHFLDCGQADSAFIELPNGKCMLIDAGEASFGEKLVKYIHGLGYDSINYIVATHPHADHIGGLPEILNNFQVDEFIMTEKSHTTKTYEKLLDALLLSDCRVSFIKSGYSFSEGGVDFLSVSPVMLDYSRLNNTSIVLRMDYMKTSCVFSGDAEYDAEADMINSGVSLKADVLKVGHHGSDTSSSENFIEAVSPKYAVISVGRNNPYGFPSETVLARFKKAGAEVFRTDLLGNILMESDGFFIFMKPEK